MVRAWSSAPVIRMRRNLQKHPLGWPQFFDPQGIESEIALALGKPGPPAYWLINQEGFLVDINAKYKLNEKVDDLLKNGANVAKNLNERNE
jgi:hypothetical protein